MSKAKSRKSTASQRQAQQRRQPATTQAAQPQARASSSSQRPQSAAARTDQPQPRTSTVEQQQLFSKYDAPPYVSAQAQGGIPFIDIANQYLVIGPSYSNDVLQGRNWQEIANELSNQNSPVAKGILGTANYLTAAICQATNQQPTQVCSADPIPTIEQSLGKSGVGAGGPQLGFVERSFEAVVRRPGRVVGVAA